MSLPPLKLRAQLHPRVWGGRQLADYGKTLPTPEPYGESWEVHDSAIISGGPLDGLSLGEALARHGHALVGPDFDPAEGFPLLIKLLDAQDWLSIQVHPNDEQAARLEGEPRGKTEAWIILDAIPNARLVIGIQPGTSQSAVASAIQENRLEELLVYAQVRSGDILYMPAGTIHAIGQGITIYEVQQSSDITYRLYDWGRMGLDGQPRPLHIDKGLEVANLTSLPHMKHVAPDAHEALMVDGPYFQTEQLVLSDASVPLRYEGAGRFHTLTCISGAISLHSEAAEPLHLARGDSALIPASLPAYQLSGQGRLLRSSVRRPSTAP